MNFEKPKIEFVKLNLGADVIRTSGCETSAVKSGLETCGCTDGYKDGATGANEETCDPGAFMWQE
jgi:hypothetical protein